ncbi:MAG: quinolinate synthase NadA [Candidatus Adiutrix sp.]
MQDIKQIKKLAAEKKAIILAHYYCHPDIHEAADFVGDSLGLSVSASQTEAEIIVFCGVHFMAETAAILSPQKTVFLANADAGCPMADMITAEALIARKKELPGVQVLTYVNSPAAVKAESDACCTSSNAVKVLRTMESDVVLMTPDRNLAAYVQTQVPEKKIIFWDGFCPIHHHVRAAHVADLKAKHPKAPVAAHPECRPEVTALADFIGSTAAIIKYAGQSQATEIIVLTEEGIGHPLRKNNPEKQFYFPPQKPMICPNMKKNSLEDIVNALEGKAQRIVVSPEISLKALVPLKRMMTMA